MAVAIWCDLVNKMMVEAKKDLLDICNGWRKEIEGTKNGDWKHWKRQVKERGNRAVSLS